MNKLNLIIIMAFSPLGYASELQVYQDISAPLSQPSYIERNGTVVIEAEHFATQHQTQLRRWFRFAKTSLQHPFADSDSLHYSGASNGQYIELLPDTRTNHYEPLIVGENFSNTPGQLAVLSYPVWFVTPGTYYVWGRAYSTGSEDNGLHVGLNGTWPQSGRRMQWCEGKHHWTWSSAQRIKDNHCGVPQTISLHIDTPGLHTVNISMREDGVELDKLILTSDSEFIPSGKSLPPSILTETPYPVKTTLKNIASYTRIFWADIDFSSASINNQITANTDRVTTTINRRDAGNRVISLISLGQPGLKVNYTIAVNGEPIGTFEQTHPVTLGQEYTHRTAPVRLNKGDVISVSTQAIPKSKQTIADSNTNQPLWRAVVLSRN